MKPVEKAGISEPLAVVWRFLTSLRLALVLISIIIILSVIGIFLVQAPQELSPGSAAYAGWLESIRSEFGIWTDTLAFFGLFSVFRSPFFLGTGILLMVNIFCCAVNRWRAMRATLRGSAIPTVADYYRDAPVIHRMTPPPAAALSITSFLLRRRYRVRTEEAGDSVFIAADRYAFSRIGTIVSHLSLILLFLGFLLGSFMGFSNETFVVAEGTTREVGHNTGLALGLVSFTADYWPDGTPRDYRSEVTVFKDERPAESATIRVNHPLTYVGVRFYQSFYGPAATLQVRTTGGTEVTRSTVALVGVMAAEPYHRPLGRLDLSGTGLTAYLVAPATEVNDPILQPNEIGIEIYQAGVTVPINWVILAEGATVEMQELEFSYLKRSSFSGFSVKYDPGTWLVWLAFGLFFIGISMVFYLPFRQIRAMVKPEEAGSAVYVRLSGRRGLDSRAELERLVTGIETTEPGKPNGTGREEQGDG